MRDSIILQTRRPKDNLSRLQMATPLVAVGAWVKPVAALLGVCMVVPPYLWLAMSLLQGRLARHMSSVATSFVPSDFFVPWYGAKALLAGRNPYGENFATELHGIFYGEPVLPGGEMQNLAAFSYPPYVTVVLAPFLFFPFEIVRWLAPGILAAAIGASAWLWLGLVRPAARRSQLAGAGLLAVTFMPALELLWLQQLTGFVVLFLVGAAGCAARRRYVLAGTLLAVAMIKPQIAGLPVLGLISWAVWRRERWALPLAFVGGMSAFLLCSELLLPGWVTEFLLATKRYQSYNTVFWLPAKLAGSQIGGAVLASLLLVGVAKLWWDARNASPASVPALTAFAATCAVAVVLAPDVSFYNRTLLVVPLTSLWVANARMLGWRRATFRLALIATVVPMLGMASLAWLQWLGALSRDVGTVALNAIEAAYVMMPVLLLPGLFALSTISTPDGVPGAHPRPLAGPTTAVPAGSHARRVARPLLALAAVVVAGALLVGYVDLIVQAILARAVGGAAPNELAFVPSDLFQPWHGGRALMAGINPYSEQFASELHQVFLGVPLHSGPGAHPEIRFFYPPFVVAVMIPFLPLPFEAVRWTSTLAITASLGATALLWMRAHGMSGWRRLVPSVLFGMTFLPSLENIALQQLSGFAIFFIMAAFVATASRRYGIAGILLALSIFKPQLAALPAAALLFWSLWQRERWALPGAFAVTASAQLALAEWLLPGWLDFFRQGVDKYRESNDMAWLPAALLGGDAPAALVTAGISGGVLWLWWRHRYTPAGSGAWLYLVALTLTARAVVVPDVSYYNRALLIAPVITLFLAVGEHSTPRRALRKLALLAVAAPYPILGLTGILRRLGYAPPVLATVMGNVEALILLLPALILAALLAMSHTSRNSPLPPSATTGREGSLFRSWSKRAIQPSPSLGPA